jgi:hypothetical protein
MLAPNDRVLLTESLRPPPGYELTGAVATTYSLDLVTLLTAPVAFTQFDLEADDGGTTQQPLALLEAVRRHASQIALFCQAGATKVPPHRQRLYGYLEDSVIPVTAPLGGVFHPKLWLLRYEADDEAPAYRLLCASRNLTFDRCWDVVLRLDGRLAERRSRGFESNRTLADFVEALPGMAVGTAPDGARTLCVRLGGEVRRVVWDLPPDVHEVAFHPLGDRRRRSGIPLPATTRRLLVISPFLAAGVTRRLGAPGDGNVLVSRSDTLNSLAAEDVAGFRDVCVLADRADPDVAEDESGPGDLRGLHAKVFVAEEPGGDATVLVGSANATTRAENGNVEFLVALHGRIRALGVDALLDAGLGSMLEDVRDEVGGADDDERLKLALEREADALAQELAAAGLVFEAAPAGEDRYSLTLCLPHAQVPDAVAALWGRPVTLGPAEEQQIDARTAALANFGNLSPDLITPFAALRLRVERDGLAHEVRFAVRCTLLGDPADRRERLLRTLLDNSDDVLRYLVLLLSGDVGELAAALAEAGQNGGSASGRAAPEFAIYEDLVRALDRDPTRLDDVARLVGDLERGGALDLLPDGFLEVWPAIAQARKDTA